MAEALEIDNGHLPFGGTRPSRYGSREQCFAAADRMLKDGSPKRAARLDQRALALAILTNKPLRREDLIELDLASDFQRDSKGRIVGLSIPGSKTKTGRDEEAWFEPPLIKRLERHLKVYRPLLPHSDSTYLFPGKDSGHRSPGTMSNQLNRLVQDQVGAEFNIHLTRHLAVTLLLVHCRLSRLPACDAVTAAQRQNCTTRTFWGKDSSALTKMC